MASKDGGNKMEVKSFLKKKEGCGKGKDEVGVEEGPLSA